MKIPRIIFLPIIFIGSPSLLAHHGDVTNPALYFSDELLELEGELTEIHWHNPHTRARVRVVGDDGEATVWDVEVGPGPQYMERRGLSPDAFLGHVKIAGHIARRGTNGLGAVHILLPSGEEIVRTNASPRWSDDVVPNPTDVLDPATVAEHRRTADGLFRTWGRRQGTNIEPQLRALDLQFTARGQELAAAYDPLEDNIEVDECRQGMPDAMFDPLPMEFSNEGDRIVLHIAEYNTRRTIHMGEAAESIEPVPSGSGHSVGRWEGDTLVVTTTHIGWPYYSELGIPQSDQASYVERFSTADGGNRLDYSVTVTDPVVFRESFTLESFREWAPGVEIPPYNCVIDWEDAEG